MQKCLSSLLCNTYNDFEIICVDDGSNDDSLDILKTYQFMDSRIIVISQPNGGVSKARNAGLAYARGEYICFVDSDDWVHPQYLEALVKGIEITGTDLSIIRYKEISNYEEQQPNELFEISNCVSTISINDVLNNYKLKSRCWGKLFRKSIINDLIFPEEVGFGEDTLYVYKYLSELSLDAKICLVNAVLYYYYHERKDSAINIYGYQEEMKSAERLVEEIPNSKPWFRGFYAIEGIKKLLRIRYAVRITQRDIIIISTCNSLIRKTFNMISIKDISIKWYLIYRFFYRIPQAYRMFMIVNDPTLLDFERKNRGNKFYKNI